MKIKGKLQSDRLTVQQKATDGVLGIFDKNAQTHDEEVHNTSIKVMKRLQKQFPKLEFRYIIDFESRFAQKTLDAKSQRFLKRSFCSLVPAELDKTGINKLFHSKPSV